METFPALLAICAGNSTVTGEFPTQRPVMRSFDVFFVLLLKKRLSKQSWDWWCETPSRPLWCHYNGQIPYIGICWNVLFSLFLSFFKSVSLLVRSDVRINLSVNGHQRGFATRKTWTCACDIIFRGTNSLHVTFAYTFRFCFTSRRVRWRVHRYQQITRQQPIKHIRKQKWTYLPIDLLAHGREDYSLQRMVNFSTVFSFCFHLSLRCSRNYITWTYQLHVKIVTCDV